MSSGWWPRQIGRFFLCSGCTQLKHDPEKHALGPRPDGWVPVFRKACPRARPEGSCSNKKIERDDNSKKSHHAPRLDLASSDGARPYFYFAWGCFRDFLSSPRER